MYKGTPFRLLSPLFIIIFLFISCSTNNSTDLGSSIIQNTYKHFRSFAMDSSMLDSMFTLPQPGDSGFGIHQVSGSQMVIGSDSGEYSAGFVRFPCLPDTAGSRRYNPLTDTLRSIVLRFWNDTALTAFSLQVWRSDFISHALAPSYNAGDYLLDSLQIAMKDTVNAPDSVVLLPGSSGGLAEAIFNACTTSSVATATSPAFKDTFSFIIANPNPSSGILRMFGNPQLAVKFKRGSDTTPVINYGSIPYYVAAEQNPGTLTPPLSYASKRTLVFAYDASKLWDSITLFPSGTGFTTPQIISAFDSLYRPGATDTISLRYLLWDTLTHNGILLDSLFAKPVSPPGVVTLYGNDTAQANMAQSLQIINIIENQRGLGPRPQKLYLYLRLSEDVNQIWRKSSYASLPLLNVTAASH